MDDLLAFLRQCLDAREQAARDVLAAEADGFEWEYLWLRLGRYNGRVTRSTHEPGAPTPREVLAEAEAKRRILDLAEDLQEREGRYAEPLVRALAQPYAGWPGWRDEWAT